MWDTHTTIHKIEDEVVEVCSKTVLLLVPGSDGREEQATHGYSLRFEPKKTTDDPH